MAEKGSWFRRRKFLCKKLNAEGKYAMPWGLQILPNVVVVRMFNTTDRSLGEMFEKAAERALSLDSREVIIDFSNVDSLDSMELMLCAYGLYHLRQLNIPVALVRPPAALLPVLQEHGMHELPTVFLNIPEANVLN